MHLVKTKKALYKNGGENLNKPIDNPFQLVCDRYSKQNMERFFSDSRLFETFITIEPFIREAGYRACPSRRTATNGIKSELFYQQLDQIKELAKIVHNS